MLLARVVAPVLAVIARHLVGAVEAGELLGIVTPRFTVAFFFLAGSAY